MNTQLHRHTTHRRYVGLAEYRQNPTFLVWMSMIGRCTLKSHPSYANYGGRGISICDRWSLPEGAGFLNFLEDMGEKVNGMTLDRVDPNGGYSPENCKWATYFEQSLAKRLQSNNKSGHRGVFWVTAKKKWRVEIKKDQKKIHIGYFLTLDAAVVARKQAEVVHFGKELEYYGKAGKTTQ